MIDQTTAWFNLALVFGFLLFFACIFWRAVCGKSALAGLISEPDDGGQGSGKASLSRFQLLIFTFVIAGLFLVLSIEAGQFVDVPEGVRWLLGISGGSFVISKGVGIHAKTEGDGGRTRNARNPPRNPSEREPPSGWTGAAK